MTPCYSAAAAKGIIVVLCCFLSGAIITGVEAADATYEGYLGDTIDLHGVSYSGTSVYLFMTGPNLPANGVTLTDVTQRADQGYFTIVDLDSSQHWSMKWNTARIENEIDPGTYTVYVVTEPLDKSQLAGNNYQTLSVYLKDSGPDTGTALVSYTMNPERHISTMTATPQPSATVVMVNATTSPAPLPTSQAPGAALPPSTTRAGDPPVTAILSIAVFFGIIRLHNLVL